MMSTAIPARLEFQCGHAALVSLPRIKGETSAQRQDRIAAEKAQAQTRRCDFCSPTLVVEATAQPDHHTTHGESDSSRQEVLSTVQSNGTAPTSTSSTPSPANDAVAPVKRGPGRPRKNPLPTQTTGAEAVSAAPAAAAPVKRGPGRPRKTPQPQTPAAATTSAPTAPAAAPAARSSSRGRAASTATPRRAAAASPATAQRGPRGRRPKATSATETTTAARGRYTVRYVVEEIVSASSLSEALRQVESRRGAEVVAISAAD